MNDTLKIAVTQEHIEKGRPRSCFTCPIGLALIDAGFDKRSITVLRFKLEFGGHTVTPPHEAIQFMDAFDERESVVPFEFEVEL